MVELLLKRISEPLLPPQSVTIPTEFIKRDSCKSILTHPDKLALDLNFGSKVLATQDGRKTNRITP
jgi:hypothetical protein